ncbi:MAG: hypothetical protein IK079_01110 [Desulfovibrio sp.]|nr:hypothetical protein [Desulfovibrio sp.]
MKKILLTVACTFSLCVTNPALAQDMQGKGHPLTPEQRAQLEQIRNDAAPLLAPKQKAWRKAVYNYNQIVAEGRDGTEALQIVLETYATLLKEEVPFRKKMLSANLPTSLPLHKRRPHTQSTGK